MAPLHQLRNRSDLRVLDSRGGQVVDTRPPILIISLQILNLSFTIPA